MTDSVAPTTFFKEIGRNRRDSWLLIGVVIVVLGVLGGAIGYATNFGWGGVIVAVVVAVVLSIGSYFSGDSVVLASSGAKEVPVANPPDEYKQLVNVVTEMSLASGMPMPRVYVIDDTAPNAFATGRDPQHASVAITIGLLQKLDREELQGVLAHEMSHVRNFDIRFSLMVGVLVGSIALLADFFLRFSFWGGGRRQSRDSGGGGLQVIVFAIAIVFAILAPVIARLVQMAISRQREYMADASGVELTRNPAGLEQALAKIALDTEPLEVANRATQHLYFENPIKGVSGRSSNLFSTHPPVIDRINRLRALQGQPPIQDPEMVLGVEPAAAAGPYAR
jgi:heat shock protein HtpX